MRFFLASKCRVCGKPLTDGNSNLLCKTCQARVRNYKWLTNFFARRVLKYPPEEMEDDKKDDVVIAS